MTLRKNALFKAKQHLIDSLCGMEQEQLRITKQGNLAKTPHPKCLGAPLTHAAINTDFGEQQLELITRPWNDQKKVLKELLELKQFISFENPNEFLWPLSMPSPLPKKVEVGQYGPTFEAQLKMRYRKGLSHRYGQNMQMISGIHFNYSFSKAFWEAFGGDISENYLHICRNFLRYGWLVTYLYGASPTCDLTYGAKGLQKLDPETLYHPFATSLRMSPIGYYSRIQAQFAVSYNTVDEYIDGIKYGLQTPSEEYAHIKEQINSNILQFQNEHYARIRPKVSIESIEKEGIKYLEVRSIDLDPFEPLGIGVCQYNFIQLFLLFCLVKKSPPLTKQEQKLLCKNQAEVALHGRAPHLLLKGDNRTISLKTWAYSLLDELEELGSLLPVCSIEQCRKAVEDPDQTLSGRILSYMKQHRLSHKAFGLHLAKKHFTTLGKKTLSKSGLARQKNLALTSHNDLKEKICLDSVLLARYEDMELSTQFLLRECLKQGIAFEIIDRKANIVLLKKGEKQEYIRQATKTSLDSYNVVELMGNKEATKIILRKNGITVPHGGQAFSFREAEVLFSRLNVDKVVVKPNTTNYGKGVHIFQKTQREMLRTACEVGFSLDASLLIEEFVEGTEYRFLIIGEKCIGVIEREPAHVVGDGKTPIKALVEKRNRETTRFRPLTERLYLGSYEKNFLAQQGLSITSIPENRKKIYLRENSNVSTGGDAIDRTEDMHPFYKKIARMAAKAIGATICGVDMIVKNKTEPGTYSIIELNYNPTIALHERPHKGSPRPVAKHLLKTLGFI